MYNIVKDLLILQFVFQSNFLIFANSKNPVTKYPKSNLLKSELNVDTKKKGWGNQLIASHTKKLTPNIDKLGFLSILLPWLYFMSTSLQIPSLPKYINYVVNNGNINVSPESARVYGNLQGIDSLFTFLSVNAIGLLSDKYGRKPFMIYSSLGLGLAFSLILNVKTPTIFYIAAMIDGCTSCMLSQAQAYITDCTEKNKISVELGKFQGFAVGMAFFFGVPLGGILSSKVSLKAPLLAAISLCIINVFLIKLFLPESLDTGKVKNNKIEWMNANPLGAIKMFCRNFKFAIAGVVYFLLQLAQSGLQGTWINYLQHRFGWSGAVSGMTLMIVGLVVAVLPSYVVPAFGVRNSILYGLILYSFSMAGLGASNHPFCILFLMPLLSAGASALPILLGYLSSQVDSNEIGALQGAADTLRTMAGIVGYPLMSAVFAYSIKGDINVPGGALYLGAAFSALAAVLFYFTQYKSDNEHTKK